MFLCWMAKSQSHTLQVLLVPDTKCCTFPDHQIQQMIECVMYVPMTSRFKSPSIVRFAYLSSLGALRSSLIIPAEKISSVNLENSATFHFLSPHAQLSPVTKLVPCNPCSCLILKFKNLIISLTLPVA